MNYLLFFVYLIILCFCIVKADFARQSGISAKWLIGLFLLKVAAGIAIGWISLNIYGPGNDYWDINREAWKEYQLLVYDPGTYLTNIFQSGYADGYSGFFSSFDSFWNDLRGNILIKLISVFNLFTRGDYYLNSLFFNYVVFFGHLALYRVFVKIYPENKNLIIAGAFLLPSMLYFSSGIHKDGLIFLLLAFLMYGMYQILHDKLKVKRLLVVIFCLLFILLIRSFIFLALITPLFAWIISVKARWKPLKTFIAVYLLSVILFFCLHHLPGHFNPPAIVAQKQADYFTLPMSATKIPLDTLQPNLKGFIVNLPQVVNHAFLRPYLAEWPVKSLVPLAVELAFYQFLFLLFLFWGLNASSRNKDAFVYCSLFFAVIVLLFIGYTVPNLGSIIRYRSIYLPYLIIPLACNINWQNIPGINKIIKK